MNNDLIRKYTIDLENIQDTDQKAIKDFKSGRISVSDLSKINSDNVNTLKSIISKIGFPTITLTSQKAYRAAVLVILHSGDIELLNNSIEIMENLEKGLIQRKDIAYMIDKMRVIQGQSQLYGTQYKIDKDGHLKFLDIENLQDLEKRRAQYGMESFVEYKKIIEQSLRSI